MPLALCALASCRQASEASTAPLEVAMPRAWPAANRWGPRLEAEYAEFVATLGAAVEARRCRRLDACLRDPAANTTYEPAVDAGLQLSLDCADLPYVLRAYFSFKRRLPFVYVASTVGRGRDPRYAVDIVPTAHRSWLDSASPQKLLRDVVGQVHSGMYRIAAGIETSDFYPLRIARGSVTPGTLYYDPNGHVLVVAEVRDDGAVYFIDGHPDGSLTWKRFGEAFAIGTARLGGGFKAFRPLRLADGRVVRAKNSELANFDAGGQYDPLVRVTDGVAVSYHAWVRSALAADAVAIDPLREVRDQTEALCRDVADRIEAVELAVSAGLSGRPHPGWLPSNIYGTDGDWELYSTPSRDARLKAAARELRELLSRPDLDAQRPALHLVWRATLAAPHCQFTYRNSAGTEVPLGLETVLARLFRLSFDPYHCPELRWGAPLDSPEFATCRDDAAKLGWYAAEARLRNRIEREYGVPTPLDSGPETAPDLDVSRWFDARQDDPEPRPPPRAL